MAKNTSQKRITKIQFKKDTWHFAWEQDNENTGATDCYSYKSTDQPRPELPERLQTLVNHVVKICELSDDTAKHIVITGISLKYDGGNRFLVISGERYLSTSEKPLIFNTPPRPEYARDIPASYGMSAELITDLEELLIEAQLYIVGERAQQKLDFGEQPNNTSLVSFTKDDRNNIIDATKDILEHRDEP